MNSVGRQKLWLDELDNRTHLCLDASGGENAAKTSAETRCVFFRELSKNLSHGASFWWMDLGGGWFDSTEIMSMIQEMTAVKARMDAAPHESIADVLVLTDEAGMLATMASGTFITDFNRDFMCELAMSGVLFDRYRLSDIGHIALSRYKLIVFAYCFAVDDATQTFADQMVEEGRTVLFRHASGIWYNGNYARENVERFTTFAVQPDIPTKAVGYPTVHISENGQSLTLARHGHRIMSTEPRIRREALRQIAQEAGCHLYAESGWVVLGDSRFLGVFSGEGEGTIHFPKRGAYTELLSGEVYRDTDSVFLVSQREDARIFVKNS